MRISDLTEREDFPAILASTLSAGWSEEYGRPFRVSSGARSGQLWNAQSLLNAYFVESLRPDARAFLRDSFRYTPVRARAPAQWLLGTLLASRPGLRLAATAGFSVSPAIPDASNIVVCPGNQRIRIFDFRRRLTRVLAKEGFDRSGMQREIALRSVSVPSAPFPLLTSWSRDGSWFEEPLLDAHALPRCPPQVSRRRATARAFQMLERWHAEHASDVDVVTYCQDVVQRIERSAAALSSRYGLSLSSLPPWFDALSSHAAELRTIQVTATHGDFQPGNILVDRKSREVLLIDWEHTASRFLHYDHLVFGLATRSPAGLARRIGAHVLGSETPEVLRAMPTGTSWRRAALSLLLLEDLRFYLSEALTGPYQAPPRGLLAFLEELSAMRPLFCV